MTIDKAIETQEIYLDHPYIKQLPELQCAMRLSTEALKAWLKLREGRAGVYNALLPSETKD